MPEPQLVQGNSACVRGALAAGCRFYAGYPITPSSEIAEEMARRLPQIGGVFVQMEDEIASLAAVIGASLGGMKAMTATSGPGFSLMQEHLGFAAMTEIPCVIVNVMRGGPSTGLPTSPSQADVMQARWGSHGDRPAIVLAPASVTEVFTLTVQAFELAERLATPVIVTYDEVIGHTRERAELPASVVVAQRSRAAFGEGDRFHVTGLAHGPDGLPTEAPREVEDLLRRLNAKVEAPGLPVPEELMLEDAELAVFAYGISARAAHAAVLEARAEGIRAGLLRPLVLWPFPERLVGQVAQRVKAVLVPEMNLGQVVHEVVRAAAGACPVSGLLQADGTPIRPARILERLRELATQVAA